MLDTLIDMQIFVCKFTNTRRFFYVQSLDCRYFVAA